MRLVHTHHLSRAQYNGVRKALCYDKEKLLPDYSTIQRYWRKQDHLDPSEPDLFPLLSNGRRALVTQARQEEPHITICHRLQWMLFLLAPILRSHVGHDRPLVSELPMFLWYDGAPISKRRQGLFSALKVVSLSVKEGDLMQETPRWLQKKLTARSWTLSLQEVSETSESLIALENRLLCEWNDLHAIPPLTYMNVTLLPSLQGVTADCGSRSKILGRNSLEERCGECDSVMSSRIGYYFLDWGVISECKIVTVENWNKVRYADPPRHLHLWKSTASTSVISYDNHHTFVGHLKNLFKLLVDVTPPDDVEEVYNRMRTISRVHASSKDKDPTRFFKGYHWRRASLKFEQVFEHVWGDNVHPSFKVLFELLREIHIFNYVEWESDSHPTGDLQTRYLCLLFMYTKQIRVLFSPEKAQLLNTLYMHKLLVHSPQLFRRLNLSSSSCEQGEGKISCVNRDLMKTNTSVQAAIRKVFLSLILEEENDFLASSSEAIKPTHSSSVFEEAFIEKYQLRSLSMKISRDEWKQLKSALSWAGCSTEILNVEVKRKALIVEVGVPDIMYTTLGQLPQMEPDSLRLQGQVFGRLVKTSLPKPPKPKQSPYSKLILVSGEVEALLSTKLQQVGLVGRGLYTATEEHLQNSIRIFESGFLENWPTSDEEQLSVDEVLRDECACWEDQFEPKAKNKDSTLRKKEKAKGMSSEPS